MQEDPAVSSSLRPPPVLDIGRAYSAQDAAAILGITTSVLNERVRGGWITPIFDVGERRYSGYMLAQILGWPLSDDSRDYLPGQRSLDASQMRRPVVRHQAAAVR